MYMEFYTSKKYLIMVYREMEHDLLLYRVLNEV